MSQALGVAHYDYGLSAHRFVTEQQIAEVLGIIRIAETASGALQVGPIGQDQSRRSTDLPGRG